MTQEQHIAALEGRITELEAELDDNDRWMREVLTDFKVDYDDHKIGRRISMTYAMAQWVGRIAELEEARDRRVNYVESMESDLELLRKRVKELEAALRQVQPDTQHYKDGSGDCCIDCPYCTIEQALRGGAK